MLCHGLPTSWVDDPSSSRADRPAVPGGASWPTGSASLLSVVRCMNCFNAPHDSWLSFSHSLEAGTVSHTSDQTLRSLAKITCPSHVASISYCRPYSATAPIERRLVRRMFLYRLSHQAQRIVQRGHRSTSFMRMEPLNMGNLFSPPS